MSTHKHIDRLCAAVLACTLVLALLFLNGEALGVQAAAGAAGDEDRLFDAGRVHTVDIIMDGWEEFLETCENEEYAVCSVVIDGEASKNVGIRAKGNTSLTTVSAMDSDRYSFKIEFDHYEDGKSWYGLDKLCLNNTIQDTTYMKDYIAYRLMASFGVDAPLCSYVWITVNGEDWGLYLAVEGVEDAFLRRNYSADHGELYKPDSMSFGGGRGNGRDFDMAEFELPAAGEGGEAAGIAAAGQELQGHLRPVPGGEQDAVLPLLLRSPVLGHADAPALAGVDGAVDGLAAHLDLGALDLRLPGALDLLGGIDGLHGLLRGLLPGLPDAQAHARRRQQRQTRPQARLGPRAQILYLCQHEWVYLLFLYVERVRPGLPPEIR